MSTKATPGRAEPPHAGGLAAILGEDFSQSAYERGLLLLLLLGLCVRAGYFIEHAGTPSFGVMTLDQKYYDTVARMMLAGQDLHRLHGLRPLLYPMFLAGLYKLGGAWGIELALLTQNLLGIATGLIVALLGSRLFRHRLSGLLAGGLYLLAPIPLYFESEILIESSYIFLICFGLLLHLRAARSRGTRAAWLWLLCGALTALAAQARANMVLFFAFYPLFALWRAWRCHKGAAATSEAPAVAPPMQGPASVARSIAKRKHAELCAPVLLGLVGGMAMMIGWGFVNLRQSDHFQLIPSAGGVNLYLGNKRSADGMVPRQERCITYGEQYEDSIEIWAREEYEAAMRAQGRIPESDPMAVSRFWTARAAAEIKAAPAAWGRLVAKKCWLTLWNAEIPNNKSFAFLQQEYAWLRYLPIRWVVLLMLAPLGLWAALRIREDDATFILLAYAGLYSAGNVAFFICDRYRYPVWPIMAVFAGGGAALLLDKLRRASWRPLAVLLAAMAMMAAVSLPNWFHAQLPSFARDYLFRSLAWYEKGRFAEALSDIDRSVALDPVDSNAQHHRGNVLFALHRLPEAKDAYQQTLALSPGESGAWNNLGTTLDQLGQTSEALEAFNRAMSCSPPSQNSFLGVAIIQIRAGQLTEATATLQQLEKLTNPPLASSLALQAIVQSRRGNLSQAAELERQACQLDAGAMDWARERTAP